jgi:hypothetical protein
MAQVPQASTEDKRKDKRPSLNGPALVRLLARLTGTAAVDPRVALSDRLSQWLGWADAITLSTVLTSAPPAAKTADYAEDARNKCERECEQLRASLLAAINNDGKKPAGREPDRRLRAQPAVQRVEIDYPVHGQRYVSLQQTMESDIGRLRNRLRGMLAGRSPEMTRLAMVDALMERTLAPRERSLLATLPGMLEKHFARLRQGGEQDESDAWLMTFRQDMRSVLRAELEVRLQPIEGLLSALLQPEQQAEQKST